MEVLKAPSPEFQASDKSHNSNRKFHPPNPKRQRTAALQDLADFRALLNARRVLECGCPLPLWIEDEKKTIGFATKNLRENGKVSDISYSTRRRFFHSTPLFPFFPWTNDYELN